MGYFDVTLVVTKKGGRIVRQPFKRITAATAQQARMKLFDAHKGLKDREDVNLEIRELIEDDQGNAAFGGVKVYDTMITPPPVTPKAKAVTKGKTKTETQPAKPEV